MLVLSRKVGERILLQVGETRIWITVVAKDRGKMRIGVEAPREVTITREELSPGRKEDE